MSLGKVVLPAARRVRRTLHAAVLRGNRHACPCCGCKLRTFAGAGNPPRAKALCPRCHSLERHRLQALYLRARTELFSAPVRMLHFAPEPCLAPVLASLPIREYVDADLEPDLARHRIDVTAIPHPDASFDAILCNHVLEHVPDDARALSELCRVLAPHGWALLQVPWDPSRPETREDPSVTDPEERRRLFGQADHVRIYGRDYPRRLERAGFAVHRDDHARCVDADRYGIDPTEPIWLCRVRPRIATL
ncbi:MAG: class I SAM-dependent methyltransferase [Planctomycetota bacterium]